MAERIKFGLYQSCVNIKRVMIQNHQSRELKWSKCCFSIVVMRTNQLL